MKADSKLAKKIETGDFIVTAECAPGATAAGATAEAALKFLDGEFVAVNLADNSHGVAIVTCPKNECRHFEGNLRAHKRAEAVESLLEEIGMGAGRMAVFECGQQGVGPVIGEIKQFIDRVRNLSPARACNGTANKQESTVA